METEHKNRNDLSHLELASNLSSSTENENEVEKKQKKLAYAGRKDKRKQTHSLDQII